MFTFRTSPKFAVQSHHTFSHHIKKNWEEESWKNRVISNVTLVTSEKHNFEPIAKYFGKRRFIWKMTYRYYWFTDSGHTLRINKWQSADLWRLQNINRIQCIPFALRVAKKCKASIFVFIRILQSASVLDASGIEVLLWNINISISFQFLYQVIVNWSKWG